VAARHSHSVEHWQAGHSMLIKTMSQDAQAECAVLLPVKDS